MLILLSLFYTIHHSITFSQNLLLLYWYIYTLCVVVSVAFSPLLQRVGAGNVWRGQRKETEEEIWHSNLSQRLHPLCALRYYFLEYQPNCTRQADNLLRNHQFQDLFKKIWAWWTLCIYPPHQGSGFTAGKGPDGSRAGSRREKEVTRLQPRAGDLLVSAE